MRPLFASSHRGGGKHDTSRLIETNRDFNHGLYARCCSEIGTILRDPKRQNMGLQLPSSALTLY